jgi:hypothetical protein
MDEEQYLSERLEAQIEWYDKKSQLSAWRHSYRKENTRWAQSMMKPREPAHEQQ